MNHDLKRTVLELVSIHGRFQPFHNGHLTYALLAMARCEHLFVGITNPDRRHLRMNVADPFRHLPENNPFSYIERLEMVRSSLLGAGVSPERFTVVPFPIDSPELLDLYCPRVPVLMRERGEWTRAKAKLLREHGWQAEVLSDATDLHFSASDIRHRMRANEPWHHLVPDGTRAVLETLNLTDRLAPPPAHPSGEDHEPRTGATEHDSTAKDISRP